MSSILQQQSFLDSFTKDYLTPLSGLLSKCRLVVIDQLKEYNRLIGASRSSGLKSLASNQLLWGIVEIETGKLLSVLFMTLLETEMKPFIGKTSRILQWSYTFTLDTKSTRRQGLSKMLRLASIIWASKNHYQYINSVPLKGAYSEAILLKFGMSQYKERDLSYYYLNIEASKLEILYESLFTLNICV